MKRIGKRKLPPTQHVDRFVPRLQLQKEASRCLCFPSYPTNWKHWPATCIDKSCIFATIKYFNQFVLMSLEA